MNKEIYVVPFFGNWAVKLKDKDTPISTHNLKDEAVRIAQQLSKRTHAEVIISPEVQKKKTSVKRPVSV